MHLGEDGTSASTSGTLTIDSWEEHAPENDADTRVGFIGGTFSSELEGVLGSTASVTISDGEFFSMVSVP